MARTYPSHVKSRMTKGKGVPFWIAHNSWLAVYAVVLYITSVR